MSEGNLRDIVSSFRKKVSARYIGELADVRRDPNDVILSYLITGSKVNSQELARLFEDFDELSNWLTAFSPSEEPTRCWEVENKDGGVVENSRDVEFLIDKRGAKEVSYAHGGILVADLLPMKYEFPSGLRIGYNLLANEFSANLSILEAGRGCTETNQIYLREAFFVMMNAYLEAVRDNEGFNQYRELFDEFSTYAPAMVLAHEMAEMQFESIGSDLGSGLDRELMAEYGAKAILEENGVNLKYYELFHKLRATSNQGNGIDISTVIVNQEFSPLG